MAGILDSVNKRTQLVGQNRLELLLFHLNREQYYGINVFKVREVLRCPEITPIPNTHPWLKGIAHIRGQTVSIIDMNLIINNEPMTDVENGFVIISEFNRSVQGFLVSSVDRIINMNWEDILPPPSGIGSDHYLTAITRFDEKLVEVLDVEKILDIIAPVSTECTIIPIQEQGDNKNNPILVVDDSSVARKQIKSAIEGLGYSCILVKNGREALDVLKKSAEETDLSKRISLVISDIEMPEMDGYTLTSAIRNHPQLKGLTVILHTSLSGVFNQSMIQRVGANAFIPKFNPDELGAAVQAAVNPSSSQGSH